MTEKRFSVKKSGSGLFYRDGDYVIDNTIQFIIEIVEMKLNQLYYENEQLKQGLNDDLELIGQLQEEAEELKQHNIELINKIDFLERVIDGDV